MFERPSARLLADGQRLLLQQGPIDLVISAMGPAQVVQAAYDAAMRRFDGLLAELCDELTLLRSPVTDKSPLPAGIVARRMHAAVLPFAAASFITPMAAVAGSVAEEILHAMVAAAPLRRAFVNNGGDIALHLAENEEFRIGLIDRPDQPSLFGTAVIAAADAVRGIATSGYPGRSFSRGIAEAVTVLAPTAAMADAAATVIANAVDLPDHPAITRVPASTIQSDSDLGDIAVTRQVGQLSEAEIEQAIASGLTVAASLQQCGLIASCAIHLQGRSQTLALEAFSKTTTRKLANA
jgi:ApbE superfamily uncharacterized protein (UPF0280 family)